MDPRLAASAASILARRPPQLHLITLGCSKNAWGPGRCQKPVTRDRVVSTRRHKNLATDFPTPAPLDVDREHRATRPNTIYGQHIVSEDL